MSHPANRGHRRYARQVKGWRRLKQDRNQHTNDSACPCFDESNKQRFGKVFSRFADTPKNCSCDGCGNARKCEGITRNEQRNQLAFAEETKPASSKW